MLIKYIYDDALAQASYLVGCHASGTACVIDPARDIRPYLAAAAHNGLTITHVTETHIHADFVSGARELAAATGGQLLLSDEGAPDWRYGYAAAAGAVALRDGAVFAVGRIRFEVIATPGHTPEHIVFLVTDTAAASDPIGIFSGDFVFVGDVGRPDLLETAAGVAGTKEIGARQQFRALARIAALPDYLQIWPGHGAGSACGKALGAVPSTTLGYERRFNPAFRFADESPFVDWLLSGQPEPPRYFAQMKRVNRDGPALLRDLPVPASLDRAGVEAVLAAGGQVFDLRPQVDFARAHLPGTVSVPATRGNFSTYVGWFADYGRPFHVIAAADADRDALLVALRAIGIDDVRGWAAGVAVGAGDPSLPTLDIADFGAELAAGRAFVLDVRGRSEWRSGHVPGAHHIPMGDLERRLDEIPRDRPVIVQCRTGYRAHIAASVLRRAGLTNVVSLDDPRARFAAHATEVEVEMAGDGVALG